MFIIKNLHVSLNKTAVLKGIDLRLEPGKVHGILGKNGAGKTTLFRTLFGFYKPRAGQILWKGDWVSRKKIALLETENYFYPNMKGLEYLQLIRNNLPQIERWNSVFDLPLDQLTQEYSTGMKKKLALMGVLLQDREVLLLDEPFNGVDLESNEKIISIIKRLRSDKTILVSSHILGALTEISDQIHVLDQGRITQAIPKASFGDFERQLKKDIQKNIDQLFTK